MHSAILGPHYLCPINVLPMPSAILPSIISPLNIVFAMPGVLFHSICHCPALISLFIKFTKIACLASFSACVALFMSPILLKIMPSLINPLQTLKLHLRLCFIVFSRCVAPFNWPFCCHFSSISIYRPRPWILLTLISFLFVEGSPLELPVTPHGPAGPIYLLFI